MVPEACLPWIEWVSEKYFRKAFSPQATSPNEEKSDVVKGLFKQKLSRIDTST